MPGPPKGTRVGGRQKGTPNKSTDARNKLAQAAAAEGETPLEYMLRVMRDRGEDHKRRDAMAVAAAPFVHPRLATTELRGNDEHPLSVLLESLDGTSRGLPGQARPSQEAPH